MKHENSNSSADVRRCAWHDDSTHPLSRLLRLAAHHSLTSELEFSLPGTCTRHEARSHRRRGNGRGEGAAEGGGAGGTPSFV